MNSLTFSAWFKDPKPIAVGVLAAVAVLAVGPIIPLAMLRVPEVYTYMRDHPARSSLELAIPASLLLDGILRLSNRTLIPDFPWLYRSMPFLTPIHVSLIKAIIGLGLLYSFKKGLDPLPKATKDLKNKTAIVTGASSGVGFETAKHLASRGATVMLVVRNPQKGEHCAELIRKVAAPGAQVHVLVADLEDLNAVTALNDTIKSHTTNGLDILVLNAGLAPKIPLTKGPSGYETSITSMHLAHFLLTKMVWKSLNKDARIVVTASVGQTLAVPEDILLGVEDPTIDHPLMKQGSKLYGRAKLANAMFARQLGRYIEESGDTRNILVSSHHPGAVATHIWDTIFKSKIVTGVFRFLNWAIMRNDFEGAATMIDACAGIEPLRGQKTAPNGSFYMNSSLVDSGPFVNKSLKDFPALKKLWTDSEKLIAPFTPQGASW